MLDDYKNKQSKCYKILNNSLINNRCSHAYLFETNGYDDYEKFVLSFAKSLLCPFNYTNFDKCNNCHQCENIDKNILENFAKTDPAKFEECVKSYSRLKKEVDSWNFTMKFLNNQLEQMKLSKKNYFGWQSLERTATQYNAKLKPILDVYEKAPAVVQKEFPNLKDAEYLKVDLQGDYFSWNVKTDWTKDYSALGNGSN